MAPAPPDDPVLASCKSKLKCFRIKELKDVLHQLGLPKHGKKQELLDKLTSVLFDQQNHDTKINDVQNKSNIRREKLVKLVDDTLRKMQDPTNTVAASRSHTDSEHTVNPKKMSNDSPKLDAVCCPCGNSMPNDSMIKCVDPQCNVWQHVSCVIVPEKPADNSPAELHSRFYCDMCRISRADPFWVTTNHPLQPTLIPPSIIAADGSYTVQYTTKNFVLSKADTEMLQKADYDLQVWCILLNDKVPFRVHWPLHSNMQFNGVNVRVVNRQPKQMLGANGRDDGPILTDYLREGSNKIALWRNDNRTFCLGIRIVKRRTLEQVLNLVPKEQDGEKFDDALTRVRRCVGGGTEANNADSDSDIEVVADSVSVNVRCPMTGSRIRVAGRFKPCAHMGCFDLEAFIEINQRSRKWQCPVCLKNYSLEDIIIDPYFNRITSLIQRCGDDVTEINVKPDGSWRVKGGPELKKLAQWHLPDGTLCMATDSGATPIPYTGIVKHEVKKEPLSEGSCRLKLGIRKNSNGQWQIIRKDLVSSDGDRAVHFENNKTCTTLTSTIDDTGNEDENSTLELGRNDCPMSRVHDLESSPGGKNLPPASTEQDVIVLSDSDDDIVMVLSPKAPKCGSVPNPLETSGVGGEQPDGGTNESSLVVLKECFGDLGLSFWDFPLSPKDDPNTQVIDIPDEVQNHLAKDQSKDDPVSVVVTENPLEPRAYASSERDAGIRLANLCDHNHDLHSDNCGESLVTAETASQKRRKSEERTTVVDASVGGNTAYDGLHGEGFLSPLSAPQEQRSVRQRLMITIDSDTD